MYMYMNINTNMNMNMNMTMNMYMNINTNMNMIGHRRPGRAVGERFDVTRVTEQFGYVLQRDMTKNINALQGVQSENENAALMSQDREGPRVWNRVSAACSAAFRNNSAAFQLT